MAQVVFHVVVEVICVELELGKNPLIRHGALQELLNIMLQVSWHYLRILMVMYTFLLPQSGY